ncbi:ketopantoate reductase PanE/ApbA-domain-containing protein [Phaeosphaeriaceae sp. PMI808]|nr:ketopantoate reductase PanE/ApbA-domain-containing protein [Phaeosphaeriaceae sp. PMI808]
MSRKIAIVGVGAIGSTWAVKLAQAGHEVTLVARGSRLARLQQDGNAIFSRGKDKNATLVKVSFGTVTAKLDTSQPYDLVLVTVLAHQVDDALFATLRGCRPSTKILFFFNTFAALDVYRNAVGADRAIFGFPFAVANIENDGTLVHSFPGDSQISDTTWHAVFVDAGIPCTLEKNMQGWLRTHAAALVGLLTTIILARDGDRGATWAEASRGGKVAHEAARLITTLGDKLTPWHHDLIFRLPVAFFSLLAWIASRVRNIRTTIRESVSGRSELLHISEAMIKEATSPNSVRSLREVRERL